MRPHATCNDADSINGLSDFPIGLGLMGLTWLMGVAILQLVTFIIVHGKMREKKTGV